MKKILYAAIVTGSLFLGSCTKDNEGVKVELEKALPTIEITSMGLMQQVGPFAQADAILVTFGGAITKAEPGAFDLAWYDAPSSGTPARVDSVHFDNWTTAASTANNNNSVTTSLLATTYPNTSAFSGTLVLKLNRLAAGNKSYTLRLYARTKDNKMATVSVTKFITVK
ncbi:MAG: hypothetical protein ABW019_01485 [Chitinophagaceae bacterium]